MISIISVSSIVRQNHLVVSVNRRGRKSAKVTRAEGAAGRNLSAVDIRNAEPSELTALADSDNSECGRGLRGVSPRDGQVSTARLVGPALGSSVGARHADNSAVLGLAIRGEVEIVVATRVSVDAVAA